MTHTEIRCLPRTMISANVQPASLTGPLTPATSSTCIDPPSTSRRTPIVPSQAVRSSRAARPRPQRSSWCASLNRPDPTRLGRWYVPSPRLPRQPRLRRPRDRSHRGERRPRGRRRVRHREPYRITPRAAYYDPKCLPPYSRSGGRPHVALASGAPHSRHSCKTPLSVIPTAHAN